VTLRAYFVAGLPDPIKPLGSFEDWSRVVASAVRWATGLDPCKPRELVKAEDTNAQLRQSLFLGLATLPGMATGMTAAEIRKAVAPTEDKPSAYPHLHDVLMEFARKGEFPSARTIGYQLRALKDRVIGDYGLTTKEDKHTKIARWVLIKCTKDNAGDAGNAGDDASTWSKKSEKHYGEEGAKHTQKNGGDEQQTSPASTASPASTDVQNDRERGEL
jgi:hypothetical protein